MRSTRQAPTRVVADPPDSREVVERIVRCIRDVVDIEKVLKAVIVQGGDFPPRTHDLPTLLAMQPESIRDNPIVAAACALLMKTFSNARYPELPEPTSEEAAEAMAAARQARTVLLPLIGTDDRGL